MLRAVKLFSVCLVLGLIAGGSLTAVAVNFDTYEMGPFHVEGMGATEQEAAAEAWGALYDTIVSVNQTLPIDEEVHDFYILNEGPTGGSSYEIDFMLIIGIDPTPPIMW